MKCGILGYGYVGKATHESLVKDCAVEIYDLLFENKKDNLYDCNVVFICIPTNEIKDIETIIREIKDIKNNNPDVTVVIRSTLPLGASKYIQEKVGSIVYIPEFLRERYWNTDCLKRPLIVGYDDSKELPDLIKNENIYKCSTTEAELVKMFANNLAVVKIAYANVFYDLSEKTGANYDIVKDMFFKVQHDQTYMEVPGHDGTRGFGGKCLPKDLDFLINTLDEYKIDQNWFKHIRKLNKEWVKKF